MNKFFKKIKASSLFLRVPIQGQVIFARHLAVIAKAGIPLLESLKILQKEAHSKSLKTILETTIDDVSSGQFLSASLDKYKNIFGNLFINIIRVGESTGILPENLNYLADELKKKQELRRKIIGALIYPIVILVATLGITGLLTVFIFPKILPVFKSLNVELPLTTKILIVISEILTNYGALAFLGIIVLIISFWLVLKLKTVKFYYHKFLTYVPVLGSMVRNVNLSNFCRTLGLALKSGIRVVEAINITGESLTNTVYKKELAEAAEEVRKGGSLAPFFSRNEHLFPAVLSQMISVGETAGNLSETLIYLSEFYESEVNESTKNLSNVLEPVLMIFMGAIVGFVALSIITPIYEVTQTIGRR